MEGKGTFGEEGQGEERAANASPAADSKGGAAPLFPAAVPVAVPVAVPKAPKARRPRTSATRCSVGSCAAPSPSTAPTPPATRTGNGASRGPTRFTTTTSTMQRAESRLRLLNTCRRESWHGPSSRERRAPCEQPWCHILKPTSRRRRTSSVASETCLRCRRCRRSRSRRFWSFPRVSGPISFIGTDPLDPISRSIYVVEKVRFVEKWTQLLTGGISSS